MLIYIIRHGETDLNAQGRLQGRIDEPLNKNGIRLARITGEALKAVPFDYLFTSPLKRARKTGELVIAPSAKLYHRRPKKLLMEELAEISFGKWEGMCCRREDYEIPVPFEEFNRFFTDAFQFASDGGETIQQVIDRTDQALQRIIREPEYQDKTILIATHGCALRGMLNRFYEDKRDFWQGRTPYNCAVSVIQVKEGKQKLILSDGIFYDPALVVDHYKIKKG